MQALKFPARSVLWHKADVIRLWDACDNDLYSNFSAIDRLSSSFSPGLVKTTFLRTNGPDQTTSKPCSLNFASL